MGENLDKELEEWLTSLNQGFRTRGVSVGKRPFLAIMQYAQDFNIQGLSFNSDAARAIDDWFTSNTKPEAHHIGSLFTSVFYYDTCFWPVDIFRTPGRIRLDSLSSLQSMPESLKKEMMSVPTDAWNYAIAWAHSLDYAYGFDDMRKTIISAEHDYALSLLKNADRELRAATSQLLEPRPNSKAAMSCRMATEIFLKAFLVIKTKVTKKELKKEIGHNLNKSLSKIRNLDPDHQLLAVEPTISIFPAIDDRYTGEELSSNTLWEAYFTTMHVASAVTRSFTDRNSLAVILEQNSMDYQKKRFSQTE